MNKPGKQTRLMRMMEEEQKSKVPGAFEKAGETAQGPSLKPDEKSLPRGQARQEFLRTEQKYPALRTIASVYRFLAVLSGIAGIIAFVIGLDEGEPVLLISGLVGGPLLVITALATAEGIIVFLDIEENTRRAANKKE